MIDLSVLLPCIAAVTLLMPFPGPNVSSLLVANSIAYRPGYEKRLFQNAIRILKRQAAVARAAAAQP